MDQQKVIKREMDSHEEYCDDFTEMIKEEEPVEDKSYICPNITVCDSKGKATILSDQNKIHIPLKHLGTNSLVSVYEVTESIVDHVFCFDVMFPTV